MYFIQYSELPVRPLFLHLLLPPKFHPSRPPSQISHAHCKSSEADKIGLSLVGYPGLEDIDPVYCMPARLIKDLGIDRPYETLPRLQSWPESKQDA
jgi:hypothetical protein